MPPDAHRRRPTPATVPPRGPAAGARLGACCALLACAACLGAARGAGAQTLGPSDPGATPAGAPSPDDRAALQRTTGAPRADALLARRDTTARAAAPDGAPDTLAAAPRDTTDGVAHEGAARDGDGAARDTAARDTAPRARAQLLRQRLDRAGFAWAGRLLGDTVPRDSAARDEPARATRRPVVRCDGQRINDIVVLAQPPYAGGVLARFEFVERAVRQLHATTRESVVRRFLLLNVGDRCDELRRTESERMLRVQPYIVDARVTPFADAQGGVTLEVETRDEFSGVIAIGARTAAPPLTKLRLGETNLMGTAVSLTGEWYDGGVGYRDAAGIHLIDYQFFGRPYQLSANVVRREVGSWWTAELALPFYTDLQRVAWRVSAGHTNEFVEFRRPDTDQRDALGVARRHADVGGVIRIGAPGRLSLFGLSLSMEREEASDGFVQLTDTGVVNGIAAPGGVAPRSRYAGQQVTRLNALWGVRNVRFMRVVGFDALTGVQDVRRGFQLGTLFGRGLSVLGSEDDDIHVSADAYVGLGSERSFLAVQLFGEGRQNFDTNRWDGIVSSGRGVWYLVPHDRHRFVTELQYAGAWHERVPYQLTLADRWGGVRGYRQSREGGGQRVIGRAEYRVIFGRLFGLGDVGAATFFDAGKLWQGDVPYGATTPVRTSAGVSVLAAVPPRSRRLWRADFAFPLARESARRTWEVRVSNRDLTRLFYREPDDVRMVRERAIPQSVFAWR